MKQIKGFTLTGILEQWNTGMMGSDYPAREEDTIRDGYLVVSLVYSRMDCISGNYFTQIGDFHVTETQLPGRQQRREFQRPL